MPDIRLTPTLDTFDYVAIPIESLGIWEKWGTGSVMANGDLFHPNNPGNSFYLYTGIPAVAENIEVWGYGWGSPDISEGWRIGFAQRNFGEGSAHGRGYELLIDGGATHQWVLRRYDDDTVTELYNAPGPAPAGDHYILVRRNGDDIEGFSAPAADPETWTLGMTVTDSTYRTLLYPGIGMSSDDGTQESWTAFGGGLRNRQHIYRWLGFGVVSNDPLPVPVPELPDTTPVTTFAKPTVPVGSPWDRRRRRPDSN